MDDNRILQEGRNCWRISHADKVAFLVDGAAYFRALYESLPMAEKQVMILAWDIYSKLRLVPRLQNAGDEDFDYPAILGELLDTLVRRKHDLRINILSWDFSLLFAMSREWLPIYKLEWNTHRRLKFCMDDQYPIGASHHQKVVVIDDALAFCGGLDLTRGRWDTPDHLADDPRREDIDGLELPIRPYHDIQMAVAGDAAASLGELARQRWQRATGKKPDVPEGHYQLLWPQHLQADIEDVNVAIARTLPEFGSQKGIREIEQLYVDAISAAQDYIYIENQYFTSPVIYDALARSLSQEHGPEIILNLPLHTEGWLSQNSMDIMRIELINKLRAGDNYGRFSVYYPRKSDDHDMSINLHAKAMIVDDYFVRIGSANLNNRSMGLDTECDLAIENFNHNQRTENAIRHFRDRLLGEHLDVRTETLHEAVLEHGSISRAINSLRGKERTLSPLEPALPKIDTSQLQRIRMTDPERPVDADTLLKQFVPHTETASTGKRLTAWIATLVMLLVAGLAWRFTPLNDLLDLEQLAAMITIWRETELSALVVIAAFVIGGLLMVPVTSLIILAAFVFGPVTGFLYATVGSVLSAVCGYGLGTMLGRNAVRELAGQRINRVSKQLAKRGLLTMLVVRIVPVAPFTIINLVAGASHIRFRDFFLGTLLGIIPGILAITLLTDRIEAALRTPGWKTILTLTVVTLIVIGSGYVLSRKLLRQAGNKPHPDQDNTNH